MIKNKIRIKFLLGFTFALLILFANFNEALASSKAENIIELFTKVNPGLAHKTAKNYSEIIIEVCNKFKQDPYAIAAIIVHESTVNNKAVSKGGDYGLMQIHWKAHSKAVMKKFPKVKNAKGLFNARINILYGTEVFAYCMSKSDSLKGGLLRYSAGNEKFANKVLATVKELRAKDKNTSVKKSNTKTRKGK